LRTLLISFFLIFSLSLTVSADDFEFEFTQEEQVHDPLEGYNRFMTSFNDKVFTYGILPLAKGYGAVVPREIRSGIHNVFDNILFPIRFINSALQGKGDDALNELRRFLLNTTLGIVGWNDIAKTKYDIKRKDEDFGQTLGRYGVGSGFHIVLPLLGPSNIRDMFGLVGDYFANPISYVDPERDSLAIKSYNYFNTFSFYTKEYEQIKKESLDPYILLRDGYEKRRKALIKE